MHDAAVAAIEANDLTVLCWLLCMVPVRSFPRLARWCHGDCLCTDMQGLLHTFIVSSRPVARGFGVEHFRKEDVFHTEEAPSGTACVFCSIVDRAKLKVRQSTSSVLADYQTNSKRSRTKESEGRVRSQKGLIMSIIGAGERVVVMPLAG